MPTHERRRHAVGRLALAAALVVVSGCGAGRGRLEPVRGDGHGAHDLGLEVHAAGGRPRLAIVRREGDPQAALAVELRVDDAATFGSARVAAITALIAARLEAGGVIAVEPIAGARLGRVRGLVPQLGAPVATMLDDALRTPFSAADPTLPQVRRALDLYALRAVEDPALDRVARCLDRPLRSPSFQPLAGDELVKTVESWRAAALHANLLAVGVVGAGSGVDAFAAAWRSAPVLGADAPSLPLATSASGPFVVPATGSTEGALLVVDGIPRGATTAVLDSLLEREGPLALRLRASDEWRARAIVGAARPEGGCVVLELEAPRPTKEWNADRAVMRAAVALEIARQETDRALERGHPLADADAARLAIATGGDAREAADRAAWWSWPAAATAARTTVTLQVPLAAAGKSVPPTGLDADALVAALRPKLAAALDRAKLAWARSEIDVRARVEPGQGEQWALVGSPCGVGHEAVGDAGLAAIATSALVVDAAPRAAFDDVVLEPWSSTHGVGVVAHAPARVGEAPAALARRVADAAARAFAASFPGTSAIAGVRIDALAPLVSPGAESLLVRRGLHAEAPEHPSWLDPLGDADGIAKVGVEAVALRLATLRAGPLRLALLDNVDAEQTDAAARAADRWTPRRPGETRSCPLVDVGATPKGAIHPLAVKSGAGAAFAFPVDDAQRDAVEVLARVLAGPDGRLAQALTGAALRSDARLVRGLGRSALIVVVLAPDPDLDAVVGKVRALFEQLRGSGLGADDLVRGAHGATIAATVRRLDPRARLIDVFLSEGMVTSAPVDLPRLRAVALQVLDEDRAQLVLARLK